VLETPELKEHGNLIHAEGHEFRLDKTDWGMTWVTLEHRMYNEELLMTSKQNVNNST
jgi:hypothetical protein